jgi:hypothetical protein
MRELGKLAAGPPERRDLKWLLRNAEVCSRAGTSSFSRDPARGHHGGRAGRPYRLAPAHRPGATPAVLGHVQDFGIAWRRLDEAIAAATAQTGARRVIRRPAVFGVPPWGSAPKPPGML